MDDIQATRRARLRELIEKQGGAASVAKLLGHTGPSYLGQMLTGKRPITEKTARAIEAKYSLPIYTLDTPEGQARPFSEQGADATMTKALLVESAAAVVKALEDEGVVVPMDKVWQLARAVYEHAALLGRVDPAHVKSLIRLLG